MSAPSIATLRKFFPAEQAKRLRSLMTGSSDNEQIMEAVNEELDGDGIEVIRGRYVDGYHQDIQAAYVNMGDTYDLTILLDHETDTFRLTSWGDWVETHDRSRELV